jgi:hypothetical protein
MSPGDTDYMFLNLGPRALSIKGKDKEESIEEEPPVDVDSLLP